MESLLLLAISLVGLAVFVAPIVSLVGFFRTRRLRAQVDALSETVARLERRVRDLSREAPSGPASAPEPAPVPQAAPVPPPAAPVAAPAPARPADMPRMPPSAPPAPPPFTPPPSAPPPAAPPPEPPPSTSPPEPPVPPAPAFDWESLLGIRGAAWLGGITLVMAALFFAKWSIDQGLVSPTVRVVLLLLAGSGALVWSELKLRDGYGTTANAVSGAGVVTLYAAFVAAHSLYQLIALPVAFAGMSIVTVTAAVIAVRHLARFTALIGLVGGLATPVLLSTGVDRPVAFFSYLTVLAVGFLHVAERRQWSSVTGVALVGTTLLQLGWYVSWMAPGKLAVASAAFAALGAAYVWHAVRTREREMPLGHQAALAGSLVPLGFVLLVAGEGRFVDQWAGVGGFLALVTFALAAAAVRWRMPMLVAMPAVATGLALHVLGGTHAGHVTGAWGLTGLAVALTIGYNLLPRATGARGAGWLDDDTQLALLAGAAPLAGLLAFGWWMADGGRLPVMAFLALLGCAVWVAIERTRGGRWPGVFGTLVTLAAISSAHWVEVMAGPQTYLDHLTIPHLLAAVVASLVVVRIRQNPRDETLEWWRRDACAVIVTAAVAYWSALRGLGVAALPAAAPYFALAGLDLVLVVGVAIRTGWVGLIPASAAAALVFNAVWHGAHFEPDTALASLVAYAVTYAGFLALPFVVSRSAAPAWKERSAPWLAAALVGPASFPVFYDAWLQLAGRAWVGVVPVGMAGVSVAALSAIGQAFRPSADEEQAARRLNYLALFAAIALGFIATAVPLQLQRQWITLGWALEAAAVWWLFGRLPHAGLKYFGLALYLAVGARLLANPEVLQYEPRGRPILNWLLYTYGVPALCCLAGVSLIRAAERRRGDEPAFDYTRQDRVWPGPLVGFLGVLLVFWLINLEIADYFSVGRYVEFDWSRHLAQDLTRSFAWGLYALVLLGVGIWRVNRGLRLVSLGFLLLTVAKVFLYDLGQLTGLYRILSFLALGVSLIMVSLLYQRFVRNREVAA